MAFALVCLLLLSLSGCSRNVNNTIVCIDDEYSNYQHVLQQALPSYTVDRAANRTKLTLDSGAAVEAFDVQAIPGNAVGAAKYWYPQYLATVVLAVDRDQTDAPISSWSDLVDARVAVGLSVTHVNLEMLVASMAYGLEGDAFTLNKAMTLLAALQGDGLFVRILLSNLLQFATITKQQHSSGMAGILRLSCHQKAL